MNKQKMTVLSILIIISLLATGGYLAKQKYDSLLKATSEGLILGEKYGRMINQGNCMFGLKMKYASCNTTECELSANGYISGCIKAAKKDGFCSAVPNIKDTDGSISWVSKTCTENNLGNEKCLKYMHKFVSACTEQNESRELSKDEIFKSGFKKGLIKGIN